jgi:hypothetical protein
MTNEELIKEIPRLPNEVKRRIAKIIDSFRKQADQSSAGNAGKIPLRDEPFVGMWADREDMKDPVEWVRNVRRTQWDRSHKWKE